MPENMSIEKQPDSSLKQPSMFVQNGAVLANIPWTLGCIVSLNDNPAMGIAFTAANLFGFAFGQTTKGVIAQFGLTYIGHTLMGIAAVQNKDFGQMATCAGGFLINTKIILDALQAGEEQKRAANINLPGPAFEQTYCQPKFKKMLDKVMNGPAAVVKKIGTSCQKTQNSLQHFGDNVIDVASRPLFAGALFGGLCDMAYCFGSLKKWDSSVIATGLLWTSGWVLAGLARPQDGQKNIFTHWYENIRDSFSKNKNKPPSDMQPQAV